MTPDGVIRYAVSTATATQIVEHLSRCDADFVPRLSDRVDIVAYAAKIQARAMTYEAWLDLALVGLIAAYSSTAGGAYITSVSTEPALRGQGIARELLTMCLQDIDHARPGAVELEVGTENAAAMRLYEAAGFAPAARSGEMTLMRRPSRGAPDNDGGRTITQRDYDAEARDTDERAYAYDVDWTVRGYMLDRFAPWLTTDGPTLEVGAFEGEMTRQIVERVGPIDAIEPSADLCRRLRERFPTEVTVIEGRIEDADLRPHYHNILLIHTLEHIDDPASTLVRLGDLLAPTGRLFVAVPNANALSRQIAVEMGLIEHHTAITPGEAQQGHRRTYTLDTLLADVRAAGLHAKDSGGVLVKPLANFQIDQALELGVINAAFLDACERLARVHPLLSSSIYVVCERTAL